MRVRATGACFRSGLELARTLTLTLPRRVLGLDYSEAMLRETSRRFDTEGAPRDALTLVRADAAQQPSSNPTLTLTLIPTLTLALALALALGEDRAGMVT